MDERDSHMLTVPACICVGRKGESHASKCILIYATGDETDDIMIIVGLIDEE